MARIFIGHSSKDRQFADDLAGEEASRSSPDHLFAGSTLRIFTFGCDRSTLIKLSVVARPTLLPGEAECLGPFFLKVWLLEKRLQAPAFPASWAHWAPFIATGLAYPLM